ncbi:hypothetical protein AMECASPLE_020610 [Ameca splendens]|uniref:Uncharacterized protein n=1 Tax=Ameca splendens TaxID=208324 RepID=A0ABV0Y382_9TELE
MTQEPRNGPQDHNPPSQLGIASPYLANGSPQCGEPNTQDALENRVVGGLAGGQNLLADTGPMEVGSGTGTSRLHGRVLVRRGGVILGLWCRSLEGGQVSLGEAEVMESNRSQQSLTGNLGNGVEVRVQ